MESDYTFSPGYKAAWEGAAFFDQADAGYLQIGGPDRQAFLQRQTTNDVQRLSAGQTQLNVLTSPAARILDVFTLFLEEDETIAALTLPGRSAQTAAYLQSRVFFMDNVSINDISNQTAQIDIFGPQAAQALSALGLTVPEPGELVPGEAAGRPLRLLAHAPALRRGYRLLFPADARPELTQALQQAGVERLEGEDYLILRVESGLPEAGYELHEDFTPLETGLQSAIADAKGCYTGQEVIARQITYDKITQSICGVRLNCLPNTGARVLIENRSIGRLTSVVNSPRWGKIGIAILKRPYHEPGTEVRVETVGEACAATVTALPFAP